MTQTTLRKALKSKTIWFSILLAVLPIIPTCIGEFNLTPIQQMLLLQLIAAAIAVLRFLTSGSIKDK